MRFPGFLAPAYVSRSKASNSEAINIYLELNEGETGKSAGMSTSSTALGTQDQYNSVRFAATALANSASASAPVFSSLAAISKTYYVLSNVVGMSAGSAVAGGEVSCRRMR